MRVDLRRLPLGTRAESTQVQEFCPVLSPTASWDPWDTPMDAFGWSLLMVRSIVLPA